MAPVWYWVCGWILTSVAVTGNGLVVLLILSRRRLHTSANWFILSLAVADLLFATTFLPWAFACRRQEDANCKARAVKYVSSLLNLASIANTCLMTLDRYVAISRPFSYMAFMKPRRVVCFIITAWLLPSCVYLIPRILWFHAIPGSPTHVTTAAILHYVFFVVPILSCTFVSIVTAHVLIIARRHSRKLIGIRRQLGHNRKPGVFRPSRVGRGSARILVLVIVVFVACYSLDIYVVVADKFLKVPRNPVAETVLRLLLIANSAVNPLVYALYKRDIKAEARVSLRLNVNRVCISNGGTHSSPRTNSRATKNVDQGPIQ